MISTRVIRLCVFENIPIVFSIHGSMPQYSISECFAELRKKGEEGFLWRYDATTGVDAELPMIEIDETITYLVIGNEVEIEFRVSIPSDVSTAAADLAFSVFSPSFDISPVFGGMDTRCLETAEPPLLSVSMMDIFDHGDQQFLARVIETLYRDFDVTKQMFRTIGIPEANLIGVPADDTANNGIIVAKQGTTIFLGKIGTTSNGQLITQGRQFLQGPVPIGGIETLPIWFDAAMACFIQLNTIGLSGISRLILCGHSLGGAVCRVLAARVLQFHPDMSIDILSFGAPRCGSRNLARAIRSSRNLRIENSDDPVPFFPPIAKNINLAIRIQIPAFALLAMNRFVQPPGVTILWPDGQRVDSSIVEPDTDVLSEMALAYVFGVAGPATPNHDMIDYVDRLELD